MTTWDQFQAALPTLNRIEEAYAQLEVFEKHYRMDNGATHGLSPFDIAEVKRETIIALREEVESLSGKGLLLVDAFLLWGFSCTAAGYQGARRVRSRAEVSRAKRDFYQFFLSLPFAERVILGLQLGSTDLVQRTSSLLEKIEEKKDEIIQHLNQQHGN